MDQSEKWIARNARIARFAQSVSIRSDNPRTAPLFNRTRGATSADPQLKAKIEANAERGWKIAAAYDLNGPDLYVDRYLRSFLREFNGRVLKGEGANMPTSFNVLRAFTEPDERSLILRLLPERIYSVRLNHILDYLTDPREKVRIPDLATELEELVIYELNMFGGYSDFRIPGHDKFVFCGAAYVREQDELSIVGVFGRENPDPNEEAFKVDRANISQGKEFLINNKTDIDMGDDSLFGDQSFNPTILLTRISLTDEKVQVRYVLDEKKDGFLVWTDDPFIIDDVRSKSNGDEIVQNMREQLEPFDEMFRVINLIPAYSSLLQRVDDDLINERHPTKFKTEQSSTHTRTVRQGLSLADAPNYVDVKTLLGPGGGATSYSTPQSGLSIETGGYWKSLPLGSVGTDKFGRAVQGKTWVTKQESWFEVRTAEAKGVGMPVQVDVGTIEAESNGFVYVMRSSAHPKDIYKVGFTLKTPDERAAQLSSTSGQPDMFNVIQSWRVKNPREIEHHVHQLLKEYRVNPGREFFKLKYREIRACIERVIDQAGALIEE